MSTQIVKGSLAAIAKDQNSSIAEAFVSADHIILVDVSGSMDMGDANRNGQHMSRYKAAVNELAALQSSLPGKIAVISFSSYPKFCPSGVPIYQGGGTDLVEALQYVQPADGLVTSFVVVSDGQPDDERATLALAKTFKSRIDTVFCGPEGGSGQDFLRQLAAKSGGQFVVAERTKELANNVKQLLLTA